MDYWRAGRPKTVKFGIEGGLPLTVTQVKMTVEGYVLPNPCFGEVYFLRSYWSCGQNAGVWIYSFDIYIWIYMISANAFYFHALSFCIDT